MILSKVGINARLNPIPRMTSDTRTNQSCLKDNLIHVRYINKKMLN